jgi:outer membrane autotransporter protein
LAIATDGALGASGTPLTLGSASTTGTLRLDADLNIANREVRINPGGGAINTNGFSGVLGQGLLKDGTPGGDFHKTGEGVLTVAGDQSGFNGGTYIDQGTLRLDAIDPGNPSNPIGLVNSNQVEVARGARLEGQGTIGAVGSTTVNKGVISPGLPQFLWNYNNDDPAFLSLTLGGDYKAEPGAVVDVGVELRDDQSHHGTLIINGQVDTSSAVTGINVRHLGGSGATTDEGIEIIRFKSDTYDPAGATNNINYFRLLSDFTTPDGRPAVVAGAYAYYLDEDSAAWTNDSLFLRNPRKPDNSRVVHPGTPIYETYPLALGAMNDLPTLQQRIGNRNWLNELKTPTPNAAYPPETGPRRTDSRGVWIRLEGGHGSYQPSLHSSESADFDRDFGRLNFGVDLPIYETEGGSRLMGGLNLNFSRSDVELRSTSGFGDLKTKNEGLGATLTWYDKSGFYLDGQYRFNWYRSDLLSGTIHSGSSLVENNPGRGYALSLETGWVVGLNDKWSVTPQAQLVYSRTNFDDFYDRHNSFIDNEEPYQSLEGRLGLAVNYENSYLADDGQVSRNLIYGLANYYHEFKGGAEVSVSTVKYQSELEDNWVGVALGFSHNWADDQLSVYGELGGRSSASHFGDNYEITGELGLRVMF